MLLSNQPLQQRGTEVAPKRASFVHVYWGEVCVASRKISKSSVQGWRGYWRSARLCERAPVYYRHGWRFPLLPVPALPLPTQPTLVVNRPAGVGRPQATGPDVMAPSPIMVAEILTTRQ